MQSEVYLWDWLLVMHGVRYLVGDSVHIHGGDDCRGSTEGISWELSDCEVTNAGGLPPLRTLLDLLYARGKSHG